MGCVSSQLIDDANCIPYKLEKTNNQSLDELFSEIDSILIDFEEIRIELMLSYQQMLAITDANKLETGNLNDSILAFLWCFSAINAQKLTISDISLNKNSPYLNMNYYCYSSEMNEYCIQFEKFLEIINQSTDVTRNEMINKIYSIRKTIEINFNKQIEGIQTNQKIIQNALGKINNFNMFFKSLNSDFSKISLFFNNMVDGANQQGQLCKKNNYTRPAQCLQLCTHKMWKPKQMQKQIRLEDKQSLAYFKKKINELKAFKKKNNYN